MTQYMWHHRDLLTTHMWWYGKGILLLQLDTFQAWACSISTPALPPASQIIVSLPHLLHITFHNILYYHLPHAHSNRTQDRQVSVAQIPKKYSHILEGRICAVFCIPQNLARWSTVSFFCTKYAVSALLWERTSFMCSTSPNLERFMRNMPAPAEMPVYVPPVCCTLILELFHAIISSPPPSDHTRHEILLTVPLQ